MVKEKIALDTNVVIGVFNNKQNVIAAVLGRVPNLVTY
jgi:hypothetical protein